MASFNPAEFRVSKEKLKRKILVGPEEIYLLPFGKDISIMRVGSSGINESLNEISIPVSSPYCSRVHCNIVGGTKYGTSNNSEFYITDSESKNGTYLNGEKIDGTPKKYWLKPGDKIGISPRFELQVKSGLVDALGNPIDKEGQLVNLERKFCKTVIDIQRNLDYIVKAEEFK